MPPQSAKVCPRLLTGSGLSTRHQPGDTEGRTVGSAASERATVQAHLVLTIA